MTAPATIPQAFRRLLQRARPEGDCLLVGEKPRYRYVRAGGRIEAVHRVSYRAVYGEPPEDSPWILHSCGNKHCCAPLHTRAGTALENSQDARDAGRIRRGEDHPAARLTVDAVRDIRRRAADGESYATLARELGVSRAAIGAVVRRRNWGWLA